MFNWLQHLFTVRALEREVADLHVLLSESHVQLSESRLRESQKDVKMNELQQVVAVKDEELRRVKDEFESFRKFHNAKPLVYPKNGVV